jgi:uncharacterized protein (DUF433 family)
MPKCRAQIDAPDLQDWNAEMRVAMRENKMNYKDIITIEPDKRGGKHCILGLRITVYDVLEYLASGMTPEEILEDFDYLTMEDIQVCLSYAADRERHQLIVNA